MGIRLTQAPAEEPVTVDEAKLHLRVTDSGEDALIAMLISAARVHAENVCRRVFVTQKWDLFLDAFPFYTYYGVIPGYVPVDQLPSAWMTMRNYAVRFRGSKIDIPFPRLQSVDAVKYIDTSGVTRTLDPSAYVVDPISEPGVLTPATGTYWPDTQNTTNAVQISFTAGYGDAVDVPAGIKSWILLRVGALYENREEVSVATRVTVQELPYVDTLLDPYRIMGYA
ncbi:head-tail connector protein [Paraburkholderia sp. BL21I4N1]|uniref:head-tail connector protein n=1 Tax=Paraburkholderia sp. BL21I4N1 TaxID=1938801 RepID=UPI000CFDDCB8|nr:head-tail connector protein [Paraburkholderia sp. BL21I4N1]PQV50975.1 putative phiE125 gp8 family phage protein [Paraburkholderia sp. BL21I4N1]